MEYASLLAESRHIECYSVSSKRSASTGQEEIDTREMMHPLALLIYTLTFPIIQQLAQTKVPLLLFNRRGRF